MALREKGEEEGDAPPHRTHPTHRKVCEQDCCHLKPADIHVSEPSWYKNKESWRGMNYRYFEEAVFRFPLRKVMCFEDAEFRKARIQIVLNELMIDDPE